MHQGPAMSYAVSYFYSIDDICSVTNMFSIERVHFCPYGFLDMIKITISSIWDKVGFLSMLIVY